MRHRRSTSCLLAAGAALLAVSWGSAPQAVQAHCQIPCGIYDDEMRFRMLEEHVTTIEKSVKLINELSVDPSANANQLVRWIMNKEHHADEMATIVTEYFLQQRIKPDEAEAAPEKWTAKVKACHGILVFAMKAKQTADQASVEKLREQVAAFKAAYFTQEEAEHLRQEHGQGHSH
jgi:nickel superoxide dismutase